jgi:SWI/SNF-related matrix-associated actin-dependent regulator 1 of chromatin subfamily A
MISVVRLDRGLFGFRSSSFSPALNKAAHMIPGLMWNGNAKAWTGYPDAIEAARAILVSNGIRIVGETLDPNQWGDPIALAKEEGLREYQKEGVRFLLTHASTGCLISDEMGLGKTGQVIRAARAWKSKTLIVAPKFVRSVWQTELATWWPEATVELLEGRPRPIEALVAITHYDILHQWVKAVLAWGPRLIGFDECHALMSEGSRRSRAAATIAHSVPLRIGLSGTPMTNRPRDLWNVVNTLSPGRFGSKFFGFGLRYCDGKKEQVSPERTVWKFDGLSRGEELKRRLSWLMLRRTTAEVLSELPPITRQVMWLDSTKRKKPWAGGVKSLRELRGLLDRAADQKLPEVLSIVQATRESLPTNTIVVFCYRRLVTEWLAERLRATGETVTAVHGGLATTVRLKRLEEAKNFASGGVIVATIDSCGVGISLAFARAVIFAELCYEPWKLRQAESRVARWGQKGSSVPILYPIARGTADELVLGKVIIKLDVEGNLGLGDDGALKGNLSGGGEERILNELYAF